MSHPISLEPDPRTRWQERVAPDEELRFDALGRALAELETQRAGRAAERVVHKKVNVGALAFLEVGDDVPAHLRVSLFARPGRFPAFVRFSNGSFRRQSDRLPDVRGLAVKVTGVPGRKLLPGLEDAPTQDFSAIQTPRGPFRGPEELAAVVRAAAGSWLAFLPRLVGGVGPRRALSLLAGLARLPRPRSLPETRYFSVTPYRLGDFAARFDFLPVDPPTERPERGGVNALGDFLVDQLSRRPLQWRLRAQLFVDERTTPIEDPTVDWPEAASPYTPLATLTLPRQDLLGARGQALRAYIEQLSFDPWHATEALRPLGATNRARRHAYKYSAVQRGAAAEPADHQGFDDLLIESP